MQTSRKMLQREKNREAFACLVFLMMRLRFRALNLNDFNLMCSSGWNCSLLSSHILNKHIFFYTWCCHTGLLVVLVGGSWGGEEIVVLQQGGQQEAWLSYIFKKNPFIVSVPFVATLESRRTTISALPPSSHPTSAGEFVCGGAEPTKTKASTTSDLRSPGRSTRPEVSGGSESKVLLSAGDHHDEPQTGPQNLRPDL